MDNLAVDSQGDDRPVTVLFHNLKGYDGTFLLQHLYRVHREVADQITVGTKILSFTSDRLTFKDSLCFLPFPDGIAQGILPASLQRDGQPRPRGSHARRALLRSRRHVRQEKGRIRAVVRRAGARRRRVPSAPRHGGLLRVGRQTAQGGLPNIPEEFEAKAEFNPFVKCVTIASACNHFWRKNSCPSAPSRPNPAEVGRELSPISPSKPCNGWRGKSIVFASTRLPRRPPPRPTASATPTTAESNAFWANTSRTGTTPPPAPPTSFTGVCGTGARGVSPSSVTKSPKSIQTAPCRKCTTPPSKNTGR